MMLILVGDIEAKQSPCENLGISMEPVVLDSIKETSYYDA